VIQFKLCRVSAELRVNRPRKSGTNTRRGSLGETSSFMRGNNDDRYCTASDSNNSRRNLRSRDKKTCVIALGFAGTVNTDNVDPLLPVRRLCYQRKPDLQRAVISRRDCRCNYKFRLWQYIRYGWRIARLWNVIINCVSPTAKLKFGSVLWAMRIWVESYKKVQK